MFIGRTPTEHAPCVFCHIPPRLSYIIITWWGSVVGLSWTGWCTWITRFGWISRCQRTSRFTCKWTSFIITISRVAYGCTKLHSFRRPPILTALIQKQTLIRPSYLNMQYSKTNPVFITPKIPLNIKHCRYMAVNLSRSLCPTSNLCLYCWVTEIWYDNRDMF